MQQETQLSLPYEVIDEKKIAGRIYLRENFTVSSRVSYKIPFEQLKIREGFNKRVVYENIPELAASIKSNGLLEPLTVDVLTNGETYIQRGHRRYKAIQMLIEQGEVFDTIECVGGFVEFPKGYLKLAYEHVRAAGGVCIADEVQTGFGRTGTHFWGFESQEVIPDIVTMAKGIGNGCPLAAVVTTPKVAQSLVGKVHFNTFGGNPVVTAMGKAVLEVIEREQLQANALKLGQHIQAGLAKLKAKHAIIGDIRGQGLMIGIELVKDRATKAPATAECAQVLETARDLGLLIGKGGLWGQTIRFAPPMCLTQADCDFMLDVLDNAFASIK